MNLAQFYETTYKTVSREFYFNIGKERIAIYLFLFLSLAYFILSLVKKIKIWKKGTGSISFNQPITRFIVLLKYGLLQIKTFKEKTPGIMHGLIFFGFLGLIVTTAILTIQEDITRPIWNLVFLKGNIYLFWSLFADIVGLLVFFGLIIAITRRYIIKPERLDTEKKDTFLLVFLSNIILTGFLAEALRIAITGYPAFEIWSPVGLGIAQLFRGIEIKTLKMIHYANWWIHMVSSFLFIALLASGKMSHIIISAINIFFINLKNLSSDTKYSMNLITTEEFETAENFGILNIEDLTWKDILDSEACTNCGRCQDNCPVYKSNKPLSPKKLIQDIKRNLIIKDSNENKELNGDVIKEDEFWACTNCGACMESCPVLIEHVPKIIGLRRHKVLMEGDMAPELQTTFQNLETNMNPYGFAFGDRISWLSEEEAQRLNVSIMSENDAVDFLYFIGSAASFDKRSQNITLSLLKILNNAGYKTGILGIEEADSGDTALRGGNEYLFHQLMNHNLELFTKYNVKKIICSCPHDYNVIKKEYKDYAMVSDELISEYLVYHHSQIIADFIKNDQINLTQPLNKTVVYHDSCFLGRYNNLFNEPRNILNNVNGLVLKEMGNSKESSFCCGAGGARMFIEEHLGTRINQMRTKEAQNTGAQLICTACPFCLTMLTDGLNECDFDNIEVKDIAEITAEALDL